MEVKIVELAENYARLMVKGEDHTFLNLLQHELVNDGGVVLAKYNITHPLRDEAELMIRTSGKDPLEVLKEANQRIISKIDEVLSQL
ncbi:RpoL/Rpb11 RNA polymerase subunit family protein [Geoglobus acetivorans]|uniref:DNA-directed RNA polymerase subunit Rpo11 n=1 Tax=Geoglobus acetivorans TaxID=565033 RepID=A0ABZ3H5W1_GEOAI|nr:DNA-directed RNA polymerase subunit L [Geoglobus acetivorans]